METPQEAVVAKANEVLSEPGVDEKARKAVKAVKAVKAKKPRTPFRVGESGVLSKEQRKHVTVVTDEADPLFNPKVRDPEDMTGTLTQFGWLATNPLSILPDGRVMSGRTKWLSLERAEKKLGHEIEIPYVVVEMDEDAGADATDALDIRVQRLNPMVIAEKIFRSLSRGKTEKEIFDLTGISPENQHGYLLFLDESKCPEPVQQMLRDGTITYAGAVEIARKAESMTKGELLALAEQVAKAAAGGVKQTTSQIKKAAGSGEGPATKKEVKQFLLDLQSDKYIGKHGEAVTWGIIIGLEVGLGTRTLSSAKSAGRKLAQGETIRVDFKQYISDANVGKGMGSDDKPVKGQVTGGARAKAKK